MYYKTPKLYDTPVFLELESKVYTEIQKWLLNFPWLRSVLSIFEDRGTKRFLCGGWGGGVFCWWASACISKKKGWNEKPCFHMGKLFYGSVTRCPFRLIALVCLYELLRLFV